MRFPLPTGSNQTYSHSTVSALQPLIKHGIRSCVLGNTSEFAVVHVRPQDSHHTKRPTVAAMAPNVKGESCAWLDPPTLYIDAAIFEAVVDDLAAPFDPADIDVITGFDAMGFVLGSAIAVRLGKGILTLRKAGKLPDEPDSVECVNYSGRTQEMEW